MIETTGNRKMQTHTTDKPFNITKKQVYEAYKAVKSNAGSAGVDGLHPRHWTLCSLSDKLIRCFWRGRCGSSSA
jgi:hypothetical protein